MTKFFAHTLLVAYTSLLMRPYSPFVMDFMAHTFWYAQHMATVHYENGKFHVHYEYLEAVRKSAPEKSDHSIQSLVQVGEHEVGVTEYVFLFSLPLLLHSDSYPFRLPLRFYGRIDPPPEHYSLIS